MVVLSRIYTRTGDDGTTGLGDGQRVPKTDLRLVAYADVDEANAALGVAIAAGNLPGEIAEVVQQIQNTLFDVGADLCVPLSENDSALRITAADIQALESWCDHFNERLESLRSFVLPGGTLGAAYLHVARTVIRRAERSTWAAFAEYADTMNPLTAQYLNRLSDVVFIVARVANSEVGDIMWVPQAHRSEELSKPGRQTFYEEDSV